MSHDKEQMSKRKEAKRKKRESMRMVGGGEMPKKRKRKIFRKRGFKLPRFGVPDDDENENDEEEQEGMEGRVSE